MLRLRRHELGLHQEQIARSCWMGQSTVHRYLERAEAAQLVWPLAEDWDDAKIDQLLFPVKVGLEYGKRAHRLRRHPSRVSQPHKKKKKFFYKKKFPKAISTVGFASATAIG